jgi:hypothetical protein
MKKHNPAHLSHSFVDENLEWLQLSPSERRPETTKLWEWYLAVGGRLEPQPDPQSPFYFKEIYERSFPLGENPLRNSLISPCSISEDSGQ